MTALTMPSQPRREAIVRPVPWRRMAWVTWRQHRLTLAGVIVVLGAASLYLYTGGVQIRASTDLIAARSGMSVTAALFQLIPALIGAFAGAPAVARELEAGTFRFTWTQGFGRTRWAVATLAPLALTVTVTAGALGLAFSWCYGSLIAGRDGFVALSPLTNITFDLRGVAIAGWTLAAFAIGALAGVLIRRVVPAMFATIAAWSGLALLAAVYLRGHYEPPLVTHTPSLPSADWVLTQSWAQDGKPVSPSAINQILQKIGATIALPGQLGPAPAPGTQSAPANAQSTNPVQYLLHHGITYSASYQPASRFWSFQWIEGAWLLALSLLLMTATVWLVRRRAA
jgi:hypothetical protein